MVEDYLIQAFYISGGFILMVLWLTVKGQPELNDDENN